jgi:hypothetical protein
VETQSLIKQLYSIVNTLEQLYPGRHFTPDGHLVGSIGESLLAERFGLQLMTASNKGYDAVDPNGRKIEIKVTQRRQFAFSKNLRDDISIIAAVLSKQGDLEVVYNGPSLPVAQEIQKKPPTKNGQHQVSVKKMREMNEL